MIPNRPASAGEEQQMSQTEIAKGNEASKVQEFLTGVLAHMQIEGTVKLDESEERIVLEIECNEPDDVQRIIGRRGQVVDALQHVAAKVMVKLRGEKGKAVVVDAGGYRQRHIERLEALAQKTAEKVKSSGQAVDLTPMPAHDRRIIHMALAAMEGVSTRSEGEGDNRHLIVEPA